MKKNEQHKSSHSLDVRVKRPRGIKRFITFSTSSQVQVEKKKVARSKNVEQFFFFLWKRKSKRNGHPFMQLAFGKVAADQFESSVE